jgi:anaerobic selenocysteine-containing dehydrogenase
MTRYFDSIQITGLDAAAFGKPAFDKVRQGSRFEEGFSGIIKTACRACIANCGVLAHLRNGRVVKLEGNEDDPMSRAPQTIPDKKPLPFIPRTSLSCGFPHPEFVASHLQ